MSDGHVARLNGVEYAAQAERLLDAVLLTPAGSLQGRAGVRPGGLGVSVGGSPESVIVAPGVGVVNTGSNADGSYRFAIPAAVSKPLGARPSAGTSRIDLVVARVLDADIPTLSTSSRDVRIEVVAGTPGASPTAPSQPVGSVLLARLNVPASGSVAVGGTAPRTVASGGVVPVASAAERDAAGLYDGLVVYREDLEVYQARVGGAWRTVLAGDTGWINLSLASGWQAAPQAEHVQYRILGGVVYLRGSARRPSGTSGTIATLPAGVRPTDQNLFLQARCDTTTRPLSIATTGAMVISGAYVNGEQVSLDEVRFPLPAAG